jgi:hypothetical protein
MPIDNYINQPLFYRSVCKHNHVTTNGRGVQTRDTNMCLGCMLDLPPGPYTVEFTNITEIADTLNGSRKYTSEEEQIAARSRASSRWNSRNPEKYRESQQRYNSKPEVIARKKQLRDQRWAAMSEEEKEQARAHRRAVYQARIDRNKK